MAPAWDDNCFPSGSTLLNTANSTKIPFTSSQGNNPTEKNISHRTTPMSLFGRGSNAVFSSDITVHTSIVPSLKS